ncbi:MAG: Gluconate 5-dehydrogenase [candidate division BRC1 bacterium ADurb.BinA364]|nr:MAG: Gluconate 5-dehydrogenase [candidate division BRC1 bacterium ADurb.BinA364]
MTENPTPITQASASACQGGEPHVMDLFRLDGRIALIIGGSKGLGKSMALGLAQAGATTVLAARGLAECEAAAGEIAEATGRPSFAHSLDVTKEVEVDRAFESVAGRHGGLDILINSAGINARFAIEECPPETFRQVIDVNLTGSWLCCRAAARIMKPRRRGSVINVGSALSAAALPGRSPYCSSKFAVIGMTRALALEWADAGVRCNALCPGPLLTEINRPLMSDPEMMRQVLSQTALNRWGELHEVRGAALFLASDASSYMTGAALYVDGGWTAR